MRKYIIVPTILFLVVEYSFGQLERAEQIVVTVAKDWHASSGVMYLFNRNGNQWEKKAGNVSVSFGLKGLAWGMDGKEIPAGEYHKKEGDNCSPAGIFDFGLLYGMDSLPPPGVNYPYHRITKNTRCVDDIASQYYNTIVEQDTLTKDWNSSENMPRIIPDYTYVLVVDYNENAVPGKGSCIFFHVNNTPTSGCTSMDKSSMLTLLRWLDPEKKTLLVQLPQNEYLRLQHRWNLPEIDLNQ